MAKNPLWEIQVGRKAEIISEFFVPAHKLQSNALKAFLVALVARYRTATPEDMLVYYVNKTRGKPTRLPFANIISTFDFERRRVGHFCGEWECYARAEHEISAEHARALNEIMQQNRAARGLVEAEK